MREILFRGKRIDNGEWVKGSFWDEIPGELGGIAQYGSCVFHHVDLATVGQFTGLTDKNGKKIFEGDIVKNTSGVVCPVVFALTGFYRKYAPSHSHGFHYDLLPLSNYWHDHGAIVEVIGNIHDNPELLEVE